MISILIQPCTDPSTKEIEANGNQDHGEAKKSQQPGGPLQAETVVHLGSEEREGGAATGAEEDLCGQGGGGVFLVRVDDVVVDRVVTEDHAEAKGDAGAGRADPDDVFVGSGTEDEEGNGHKGGADQCTDQTVFGGRGASGADGHEMFLGQRGGDQGQPSADQDRDKHQANLPVVVPVQLTEDDRVGEEEGIEHGVDQHNVHAHQVEDGLSQHHGQGPHETGADNLAQGDFGLVLFGDDVVVARLAAQPGGASTQDHGRIRLRDQGDHDHDDAGKGHVDPEEEIEAAGAHVDPARDDGSNHGPTVRRRGKIRNRHASILDAPDIGDGAACERQARAGEDAA